MVDKEVPVENSQSMLEPEQRKIKSKKKAGRKTNIERRMRNIVHRVPVSGERDILTVRGLDEKHFAYRWVLDVSEAGSKIFNYTRGGWVFVPADEVEIGQELVFKSPHVGSVIRVPANRLNDFLYLMKIDRKFYDEDQEKKNEVIDHYEASITADRGPDDSSPDSLYGGGSVSKRYTTLPK